MSRLSSSQVHPTAVIHPGARLGSEVRVGPYCVVGEEVEIEDGCELMAHIYMEGPLRIGPGNKFFPYSSVGVVPQDLKFRGERTETIIGERNTIREFVTIHRGTEGGGSITQIGNENLIMAYVHVAHDCRIGNNTILANGVTLAGHVVIEDYASIGAFCGIHQFSRIGQHCFVAAYSTIGQDVLPFSTTASERATHVYGINSVGLQRRGFSADRRNKLKHAMRLLTASKLNTSQAIEQIKQEDADSADVQELIRFIEHSERGVIK
jgi:UDP-N-acetylglucosamine acyltransferase